MYGKGKIFVPVMLRPLKNFCRFASFFEDVIRVFGHSFYNATKVGLNLLDFIGLFLPFRNVHYLRLCSTILIVDPTTLARFSLFST